jgi:hypothetical protein
MKKADDFADEIKKKIKGATARDVSTAIFYYIGTKSMMPTRSAVKKNFKPAALLKFMKAKKLTLKDISEKLSNSEDREALAESLFAYLTKAK